VTATALFLIAFFLFFILGVLQQIAKAMEAISAFYVGYSSDKDTPQCCD